MEDERDMEAVASSDEDERVQQVLKEMGMEEEAQKGKLASLSRSQMPRRVSNLRNSIGGLKECIRSSLLPTEKRTHVFFY